MCKSLMTGGAKKSVSSSFAIGRRSVPQAASALIEQMETRRLLSSVVRIVAYNMAADINGVTTPLPGFYQNLEGIGEEKVAGNVRPIDILGLEETTSNATTVAPIVTNLNSYYNGAAVYAQSPYQATQDGGATDGNGPNAMVYNTSTLKLLASVGVGTPGGSSNGEYRQVVRYEFQPVGDSGSTGVFYVYVSHMKSGTTSADAKARGQEATIIRNDEATLPANSSVVYMGDLNSNPPEAEFTNFTAAGQGQAFDQTSFSTSVQYYSDATTDLRYRDDYQLITQNVLNDTGNINYVAGSYHSFGNNGTTASGGSINSSTNTSLNSDLVQDGGTFISASTLYADLTTGSDHLPVVSDYTIASAAGSPVIGSFAVSPTSVTVGASATLTASNVTDTGSTITGVNFYRESNGTSGLQIGSDTLVGAGTASGTTWTLSTSSSGLTAGSYTYYAVATDASGVSSPVLSTTLSVTNPTGAPTIGSFVANPASVTVGASTTLTASNVTDTGSTITGVNFYRESNGTSGLQIGSDTLVGAGTASGTTWTLSASTTGLAAGTYTYYAVATDASGVSSPASSTTLTVTTPVTSGAVLTWDVKGQTGYGTQGLKASQVAAGLTNSLGLTRGSGVGTSGTAASNAWGGNAWASTSSAGITGSEYVTFGVTVSTGSTLSLSALDMNYRRSSTGPSNGYWQYQINGGAFTLIGDFANQFSSTSSSGAAITEMNLSGISGLQNLAAGTAVTFRLVPYDSSGSSGTWYVYDVSGSDLVVSGSTGTSGDSILRPAAAGSLFSSQPIAADDQDGAMKDIIS